MLPGRRIKILAAGTLVAACSVWLFRPAEPAATEIRNACNTFVSEFAPSKTPALRARDSAKELTLSFTPAKDEEATRIIAAVAAENMRLRVVASNAELRAVRVSGGHLTLEVQSLEQAKSVLRQLCFMESEVAALSLSPAQ
jgi:hypothetical protein